MGMKTEDFTTLKKIVRDTLTNSQALVIWGLLVAYFVLAIAIYMPLEGWDVGDCMYYAIVVVTTVGYGDLLPTGDAAKVATVLYAHVALVIISFCLDNIIQAICTQVVKATKAEDHRDGLFAKEAAQKKRRFRLFASVGSYAVVLLVGTLVFATQNAEIFGDEGGNRYINGLYLTVITVTTIGFGDFSPMNDENVGLPVFGACLMIIGIPIAGSALGSFTQWIFGERQNDLRLRLVQGDLSKEKFDGIKAFVESMREDGVGNYREQGKDQISRFEYLCFVLVQNNVVQLKNIQNTMVNFDKLDASNTGFISAQDIKGDDAENAKTILTSKEEDTGSGKNDAV